MNNQDSVPSSEANNLTAIIPMTSNLTEVAEAQDQDFKLSIINMFKDLKEEVNKMPQIDE